MNREDLKEYIGITAFSLGHVEKDYFQHILLGVLSRKWSSNLIFKGGTALQKIGMITRFSEDLDFTEEKEISPKDISDSLKKAIESYNYPVVVDRFTDEEITAGFRMKIEGPLYRNNRGVCSIRFELSRREEVLLKPHSEEIDPPYKDVLPYVVKIMDKDEILSEKIRAILTRDKVRDVYDTYKLIENGAKLREDLINKKLEFYDMKLDKSELIERCKELSVRWDKDLASLMKSVPPKDSAVKNVIDEVKSSL
ncbi:MAG: nucleotidyl transferase AbiEii/AbiGii toxin family protein [Thermoplasmata archaeon]